ncbi:MAG: leucine-rich repeat domain-containing protein [Prevotellaceae bacterium]|nr:leucine-rich repeat domain-containing protein [Prevotellaceae bacterium]
MKEIGGYAFTECNFLKASIIVNRMFVWFPDPFEDDYSIPSGIKIICGGAFRERTFLRSVDIPDSVTEIGHGAFSGCSSLKYIDIPDSVTKIEGWAFDGCSSLESVEIPDSVTEIGEYAFAGCSSITSIKIPYSVTEIGNGTFSECSSLKYVDIPNSVTKIGSCAFGGCSVITNIEIPSSVTEIGERAFVHCKSLANIEIPDSVKQIGIQAFDGCESLRCIEIPDSIVSIPSFCFSGTKLKKAFIHKKIEKIENHAFDHCPIENYEVEVDNPTYTSKDGILMNKAETTIIKFPARRDIKDYKIPIGIQSLGDCAFGGALFQNIEIPNTINKIDSKVFFNCNKLTEIHLRVKDPCSITVSDDAFEYLNLDHCTLYVPIGTGYAYRHHPVFGQFKEVVIER